MEWNTFIVLKDIEELYKVLSIFEKWYFSPLIWWSISRHVKDFENWRRYFYFHKYGKWKNIYGQLFFQIIPWYTCISIDDIILNN